MPAEEWVTFEINNNTSDSTITVKNAKLISGQFHRSGNQDDEISASEVESITISANATAEVNACGRDGQMDGTEGQFDLYDGNTKLRTIHWNNGSGGKHNHVAGGQEIHPDYFVDVVDDNPDSGAIGKIPVEIEKRRRM